MKHPYAEILQAVIDCKQIQFQTVAEGWQDTDTSDVLLEIANDDFEPDRFRIKPATITINGCEVEAPGNGDYSLTICVGNIYGPANQFNFATKAARDAAYAALILPFGEQAHENIS